MRVIHNVWSSNVIVHEKSCHTKGKKILQNVSVIVTQVNAWTTIFVNLFFVNTIFVNRTHMHLVTNRMQTLFTDYNYHCGWLTDLKV